MICFWILIINLLGYSYHLDIRGKLHLKFKFNSDSTQCEGSRLNLLCNLDYDHDVNGTMSIQWLQEPDIPEDLQSVEQTLADSMGHDRLRGLKTFTLVDAVKKHAVHLANRTTVDGGTWLNLTIGPLERNNSGIYTCSLNVHHLFRYMRLTVRTDCYTPHQSSIWISSTCFFCLALLLVLISLFCIFKRRRNSTKSLGYKLIFVKPESEHMRLFNQSTGESTTSSSDSGCVLSSSSSTYDKLNKDYATEQPVLYPSVHLQTILNDQQKRQHQQHSRKQLYNFSNCPDSKTMTTTTMNSSSSSNSQRFGEYTSLLKEVNERFQSLYRIEPDWEYELARDNLQLGSCLGSGAFGVVYMGIARNLPNHKSKDPVSVAVKTLRNNFTESDIIDMMKEFFVLKQLHHEHVIKLYAVCTQNGAPYLIMEYAPHGNLQHYLRSRRHILESLNSTAELLLDFGCQIADGMRYLASKSFVHRDLAARNILVGKNDTLKISDFGLARIAEDYYRKETKGRIPIKWMAPECLFDRIYTTKSDVWSFGVLLWEIYSFGTSPFKDISPQLIPTMIRNGHRNPKPSFASDQIYALMSECWAFEPQHRPSFHQLVQRLLCVWEREKRSTTGSVSPTEDQTYQFLSFRLTDNNDEHTMATSSIDPCLSESGTCQIRGGSDTLSSTSLST